MPLERLAKLAEIAARMKSAVDLWDAQNAAWQLRSYLPRWQAAAAASLAATSRCTDAGSADRSAGDQRRSTTCSVWIVASVCSA